ncbi:hypothetical protein IV102_22820 [bacterium]|nr:hypothetical protein [bacterium]
MRIVLWLFMTLVLVSPLPGEDNPSRRPIPDPTSLASSNSLSLFVVSARPEKAGLRQLFKTALNGTDSQGGPASMGSLMSDVISRQNQQNLIMAALPLQWVRVDQPDSQGRLRTLTVLSVSGWQGMQALFYQGMLAGKVLETRRHRGEVIVLRPGWQNPEDLMVMARSQGSFVNCATPELARQTIDRLLDRPSPPGHGPLWDAYAGLCKTRDIYGAAVNRNGSLLRLISWAGRSITARIRREVGAQNFDRIVATVRVATLEAEVISDDQIDLELRFSTATPSQIDDLKMVWLTAQHELKSLDRLSQFRATPLPSGLLVNLSITGFRGDVSRFLGTLSL